MLSIGNECEILFIKYPSSEISSLCSSNESGGTDSNKLRVLRNFEEKCYSLDVSSETPAFEQLVTIDTERLGIALL